MRPAPSEYFVQFERYISLVEEGDVVPAMKAQGQDLQSRLDALTEAQAGFRYAPGKWTTRETLGHVIDCERIFGYRALCLARGESQSLPGFEQDDYATVAAHDAVPLTELVDEFAVSAPVTSICSRTSTIAPGPGWGWSTAIRPAHGRWRSSSSVTHGTT